MAPVDSFASAKSDSSHVMRDLTALKRRTPSGVAAKTNEIPWSSSIEAKRFRMPQ